MRKQIPFRYDEKELHADFETLLEIDTWNHSQNRAMIRAIKIAAAYIRKINKVKPVKGYQLKERILSELDMDLY